MAASIGLITSVIGVLSYRKLGHWCAGPIYCGLIEYRASVQVTLSTPLQMACTSTLPGSGLRTLLQCWWARLTTLPLRRL